MKPVHTYTRRQSPFLAVTEGAFEFLHLAHRYPEGQRVRTLTAAPLGWVYVPSGRLVIADPFSGLRREGNGFVRIRPGAYRVVQTLMDSSPAQDGSAVQVAVLSVILDEALWARRDAYQATMRAQEYSPEIPASALRCLFPTSDGGTFEPEDASEPDIIRVRSGTVALVDAQLLLDRMPVDSQEAGNDWWSQVFAHGLVGSWFDGIDDPTHYRVGAANLLLPQGHREENIVLSQSGEGDGRYALIAEHAFDFGDQDEDDLDGWMVPEHVAPAPVMALHVDFRLIPCDPFHPIARPADDQM